MRTNRPDHETLVATHLNHTTPEFAALLADWEVERWNIHHPEPRPKDLALGIDLRWDRNRQKSAVTVPDTFLPGWYREHLEVSVIVETDSEYESIMDQAKNEGLELVPWAEEEIEVDTGEVDDDGDPIYRTEIQDNRPSPWADTIELPSCRRHHGKFWLNLDPQEFCPEALRKDAYCVEYVMRVYTRAILANWESQLREGIRPYTIVCEVRWRGEVVGSASLGMCYLDSESPDSQFDLDVAGYLNEGILAEAEEAALGWRDGIIEKLVKKIEGLPPRRPRA